MTTTENQPSELIENQRSTRHIKLTQGERSALIVTCSSFLGATPAWLMDNPIPMVVPFVGLCAFLFFFLRARRKK